MKKYIPTAKVTAHNAEAIDAELILACISKCTEATRIAPIIFTQHGPDISIDIEVGYILDSAKIEQNLIQLAGDLAVTDRLKGQPFTITLREVGLDAPGTCVTCTQHRAGGTDVETIPGNQVEMVVTRQPRLRGQAPNAEALALFNLKIAD